MELNMLSFHRKWNIPHPEDVMADMHATPMGRHTALERFLSLFATIRPGEGPTALLLMINVFVLLMAYYIIKPVREALVLEEAGAEIKTYASAIQAMLFVLIVPLYGR